MTRLFSLDLGGSRALTGRVSIPNPLQTSGTSRPVPLLVCIHGGSYDSEYFDIDSKHSIFELGRSLRIPVVAIDRPGYGGSTAYPDLKNEDIEERGTTFSNEQGKYLDSIVFPALWKEFGPSSGAASMVVFPHSIGGMVAIIAAAMYANNDGKKQYPLTGLIVSGIGCKSHMHESPDSNQRSSENNNGNRESLHTDEQQTHMRFNPIPSYTEALNKPVPLGELHDIRTTWQNYWVSYAEQITVPFLYGVGDHDGFWDSSEEGIAQFTDVFRTSSPRVQSVVVPMAPHCVEMSCKERRGYYAVWDLLLNVLLLRDQGNGLAIVHKADPLYCKLCNEDRG
ncbi:alpha/beta fold hydrolase [Aspergillus alliaceus]|uniref:alpha/beta fold hydrolase n=1 Tax=Petromyces alliaceus TaxID=209559 RepID=UPI0012A5AFDF|nr:Alpha/Beta hydrolase protein [Aspergillus alliaceus]KAB8231817.1 Alpha/Beta hydrolase protein [Aspergillus alliaceus]